MSIIIFKENKYQVLRVLNKYINSDEVLNIKFEGENLQEIFISASSDNLFKSQQMVVDDFDVFANKTSKLTKKEKEIVKMIFKKKSQNIYLTNKEVNINNDLFLLLQSEIDYIGPDKVKVDNIKQFIEDQRIKISSPSLNYLKNNLSFQEDLVINELLKLSNYTNNEEITKEIIDYASYKDIEANLFDIINFYLEKKIIQQKKLYLSLKEEGYDSMKLLGLIISQFRVIYKVKMLNNQGYNYKSIAQILKLNEYRVKILLTKLKNNSIARIEKRYLQIAEYEYLIKSGQINQEIAVDLLINS